MHNDLDSVDTTDTSSSGVSRRSVVKTGAHLAWAVPAVTLATAAPALAVSPPQPGPALIKITGFSANYTGGASGLHVTLSPVKNKGKSDAGQLTAVISLPVKDKGPFSKAPKFVSAHGPWTFAGRDGDGPWAFTFVSNDGHVKPGEKTGPLDVDIDLNGKTKKKPAATISVSVIGEGSSDQDSDSV
ncbi:hypothetical protein [Nocardioides sp. LS1]|uniref:hypothetical protein n=1 Tax=Nocardioides sp. LS1 TaxID=1027620 RepID=UPI000F617CFC|nr:hypothetical protein [Nocardioides sp. LS1]GCD90652.1 hypothetical protein NLS1_26580 [Nocardioides sp. LS1]